MNDTQVVAKFPNLRKKLSSFYGEMTTFFQVVVVLLLGMAMLSSASVGCGRNVDEIFKYVVIAFISLAMLAVGMQSYVHSLALWVAMRIRHQVSRPDNAILFATLFVGALLWMFMELGGRTNGYLHPKPIIIKELDPQLIPKQASHGHHDVFGMPSGQ